MRVFILLFSLLIYFQQLFLLYSLFRSLINPTVFLLLFFRMYFSASLISITRNTFFIYIFLPFLFISAPFPPLRSQGLQRRHFLFYLWLPARAGRNKLVFCFLSDFTSPFLIGCISVWCACLCYFLFAFLVFSRCVVHGFCGR